MSRWLVRDTEGGGAEGRDGRDGDGEGRVLELFRPLAADDPELGTAEDVAAMRRAVTELRRSQRLLAGSEDHAGGDDLLHGLGESPRWAGSRLPATWRRAAAVGLLVLGLLALATGGYRQANPAAPVAATATAPAAAAPNAEEVARKPVFEGLDQPGTASVYEFAGDDLYVVMVVDETLDV